jgi:hypothetical protein
MGWKALVTLPCCRIATRRWELVSMWVSWDIQRAAHLVRGNGEIGRRFEQ